MPDMVQNAVERVRELLAQLQRDRDAAELICLRAEVRQLHDEYGPTITVRNYNNKEVWAICDITEAKDDDVQNT